MTTALASEKGVKPKGLPKDYLSLKEFSEKYPDFFTDYMTSANSSRPMRVWVNSDRPVFAMINELVKQDLTPEQIEQRRKLRGKTKFKMEEDRYKEVMVQIPGMTEYEMSVRNFVYLWSDPNFRLDSETKPEKCVDYVRGMSESRWNSYKNMALDRFRRNPAAKEYTRRVNNVDETIPSRYKAKTFDTENTALELWGIVPDVYVLPPDSYSYTVKEDSTIESKILDALKECDLSGTKAVYRDDEIEKLKDVLIAGGVINESASLTKVRQLIKFAQVAKEESEDEPAT